MLPRWQTGGAKCLKHQYLTRGNANTFIFLIAEVLIGWNIQIVGKVVDEAGDWHIRVSYSVAAIQEITSHETNLYSNFKYTITNTLTGCLQCCDMRSCDPYMDPIHTRVIVAYQ